MCLPVLLIPWPASSLPAPLVPPLSDLCAVNLLACYKQMEAVSPLFKLPSGTASYPVIVKEADH